MVVMPLLIAAALPSFCDTQCMVQQTWSLAWSPSFGLSFEALTPTPTPRHAAPLKSQRHNINGSLKIHQQDSLNPSKPNPEIPARPGRSDRSSSVLCAAAPRHEEVIMMRRTMAQEMDEIHLDDGDDDDDDDATASTTSASTTAVMFSSV